ncbi:uncharacterized protein LOC131892724 [Tigriopus californicus]|uniref:uncharacterized protein LOC131892724 n=1 Tax=Tigriopus californicus TaxID=6832 RepID=UPI0027DA1214|nr:uncharacterized protein LOC131892724 [Tigriopus californicus]
MGHKMLQKEATNGSNQLGYNSPDEEISDWPTSVETEHQEFLRPNPNNRLTVTHNKSPSFRSTNAMGDCAEMRRRREKSTVILVTIVLLFCGCHSYRLALKVYEFLNPNRHVMTSFNHCYQLGK